MSSNSFSESPAAYDGSRTGFMSLPRELRDLIYDLAHHDDYMEQDMDRPRDYRIDGCPEDVDLTRFYTDEYLESVELQDPSCEYKEHWLPCRDQKQCLQQQHSRRKKCGTFFFTTHIPLPQLRLVSRQVKLEYDERSHANSYIGLCVEEDEDWRSMFSEAGKRIIARPAKDWSAKFAALHPFIRAQPSEVDVKMLIRLRPESHILYDLEVVREIALWLPRKLTDISRVKTLAFSLHFTGEAWEIFDDIVDWKDIVGYKSRIDASMYGLECPTKPTKMSIAWSADEMGDSIEFATWTPAQGFVFKKKELEACCVVMELWEWAT